MEQIILPQTSEHQISTNESQFIVTPLFPGFGHTIGNSLRRVLLSSLPGAAVTTVKIDGVNHEFTTVPGVKEDMVELILNLKSLRVQMHDVNEPVILKLEAKGGEVTAADFQPNSKVTIANPQLHLATLSDKAKLSLEVTVEYGRGYDPVEKRETKSNEIGQIAVDSLFSPVEAVALEVKNTRVGKMTNYDELIVTVKTDGTITPLDAFKASAAIMVDQFHLLATSGEPTSTESTQTTADDLGSFGLTAKALKTLADHGIQTIGDLQTADAATLSEVSGLSAKAQAIINQIRESA